MNHKVLFFVTSCKTLKENQGTPIEIWRNEVTSILDQEEQCTKVHFLCYFLKSSKEVGCKTHFQEMAIAYYFVNISHTTVNLLLGF